MGELERTCWGHLDSIGCARKDEVTPVFGEGSYHIHADICDEEKAKLERGKRERGRGREGQWVSE